MNEMQTASMLTLYMILFTAVIQDFMCMKISNRLILMGLFCSIAFGISIGGVPQIIYILWNISFPVIILYLLYVLGILGAGDIKLFSVIGGFTNFKTLTDCILAALLVGRLFLLEKCYIIAICSSAYSKAVCFFGNSYMEILCRIEKVWLRKKI